MGYAVCAVVARDAQTNSSCKTACEQYTGSTCLGASWGSMGPVCMITVSNRLDIWTPAQDYQAMVRKAVPEESAGETGFMGHEHMGWIADAVSTCHS